MSTYLRKCIDIAPTAISHARPDRRRTTTATCASSPGGRQLRATTSHLRLLADWPSIQPVPASRRARQPGAASLAALDAQVDAALADGMKIILVPYRYPRWANGTDGLRVRSVGGQRVLRRGIASRAAVAVPRLHRGPAPDAAVQRRCEYRLPPDGFGPDSRGRRYVEWLWDRYADRRRRRVRGRQRAEPAALAAADHVETDDCDGPLGHRRARRWSIAPRGRGDDDHDGRDRAPPRRRRRSCSRPSMLGQRHRRRSRARTTISHTNRHTRATDPFAESLLDGARARGFDGGDRWIWSFHNYTDVERKQLARRRLRRSCSTERGWSGPPPRRRPGGVVHRRRLPPRR